MLVFSFFLFVVFVACFLTKSEICILLFCFVLNFIFHLKKKKKKYFHKPSSDQKYFFDYDILIFKNWINQNSKRLIRCLQTVLYSNNAAYWRIHLYDLCLMFVKWQFSKEQKIQHPWNVIFLHEPLQSVISHRSYFFMMETSY